MKNSYLEKLEQFRMRDVRRYFRAYHEGRIPEDIIRESMVTCIFPGLFRIQVVPLPRDLRFREALLRAKPRKPWWRRMCDFLSRRSKTG